MAFSPFIPEPLLETDDTYLEKLTTAFNLYSALSDILDISQPEMVRASDLAEMTQSLISLTTKARVNPTDIRSSGVLGALKEITVARSRWPFAVRVRAHLLLQTWEKKFGKRLLDDGLVAEKSVRPIVAGDVSRVYPKRPLRPSGDAAGVSNVAPVDMSKVYRVLDLPRPGSTVQVRQKPLDAYKSRIQGLTRSYPPGWNLNMAEEQHMEPVTTPFAAGPLSFVIGDWWPGPAAAARANIIQWKPIRRDQQEGDPTSQKSKRMVWETTAITADEQGAYAIMLVGSLEVKAPAFTDITEKLRFHAHPQDPERKRPMKNLRTRIPIRLLRSCRQIVDATDTADVDERQLTPVAGVRYDGLYRVTKYSLKSTDNVYNYQYDLERCDGQSPMTNALAIPTSAMINNAIVKRALDKKSLAAVTKKLTLDQSATSQHGIDNEDGDGSDQDEYWDIAAEPSADKGKAVEVVEEEYARAQVDNARQALLRIRQPK